MYVQTHLPPKPDTKPESETPPDTVPESELSVFEPETWPETEPESETRHDTMSEP